MFNIVEIILEFSFDLYKYFLFLILRIVELLVVIIYLVFNLWVILSIFGSGGLLVFSIRVILLFLIVFKIFFLVLGFFFLFGKE